MKLRQYFGGIFVALASFGVLLPQAAQAAATQLARASSSAVRDVALRDGGRLTGQVLDAAGAPVADTAVAVVDRGQVLASARTTADGRFAITGVQAGVCEVATTNGVTVCRLWAPRTAPPAAQQDALVIHGNTVVRGGDDCATCPPAGKASRGGVIAFLSNPWVLGGIVAAAVAIPLALDDDDAS
jgi:hypothetical protein